MTAYLGMIDVVTYLFKTLAIAGGAALGGLGSGLMVRLIAKASFSRKVPRIPLRIVQVLGATSAGLVVYWAFVVGGLGFGGGDGSGAGGKGLGRSLSDELDPAQDKQEAARATLAQEKAAPGMGTLRVEMLGGDRVKEERFYLIEGEKEARNLADLRKAIRLRLEDKDKPALKSIELVIYENSVAPDHQAVRDLEKWARQNDLGVSLSKPAGSSR